MPDTGSLSFHTGTMTTQYTVGTDTGTVANTVDPTINNTWMNDSLSTLFNPTGSSNYNYVRLPNSPGIPAPTDQSTTSSSDGEVTWPASGTGSANTIDSNTITYDNLVLSNITSQIGTGTPPVTAADANEATYYFMNPPPPSGSTSETILNNATSAATTQFIAQNNLPSDWTPSPTTLPSQSEVAQNYNASVGDSFYQAFLNATANDPNQAAELTQFIQSGGTEPQPAAGTALASVASQFNLPSGVTPAPSQGDYTNLVNSDYNNAFTALLNNDSSLSQTQMAQVEYYFNNPPPPSDADPAVVNALQTLTAQAQAQITSKYALKADFDFTPSSGAYNAIMNGYYNEYVQNETNKFLAGNPTEPDGTPWTQADEAALTTYLANPNATGIPSYVATAGQQIQQSAIQDVETNMNLGNIQFTPAAPGTFKPLDATVTNALSSMDSMVAQATAVVNAMPDGPQKTSYLNILKEISDALQTLKEAIYGSESQDSNQINQNSQAQLEIALANIQEQMAGAQEANNMENQQSSKSSSMATFGQVMQAIMAIGLIIASIAMANPLSVLGVAVGIAMFINAVDPKINPVQMMMTGITELVQDIAGPNANPAVVSAIADTLQAIAIIAICIGSGPMGFGIALPQLLQASGIITDCAIAAGASPSVAQEANQYASMAIGIVAQLGVVVATGGAALMEDISEAVATAAAEEGATTATIAVAVVKCIGQSLLDGLQSIGAAFKSVATSIGDAIESIGQLIKTIGQMLKSLLSGSAEGVEAAAEATQDTTEVTTSMMESISKAPKTCMEVVQTLLGAAQGGVGCAQGIMTYKMDNLLAQVALIRGTLSADQEKTDAAVAQIAQLIKKLLNILSSAGDFVQDIQSTQTNMYAGAENSTRPVVA